MLRLKKFKRVFTLLTLGLTCFTTVFGQLGVPAYAEPTSGTAIATAQNANNANKIGNDSNKLRSMYIQFAQRKKYGDIKDIENLTASDLQILGTFLSNFYTPWETRVDTMDINSATMQNMTTALETYCGYDQSIAQGIVKACWSVSMDAQPLKIAQYDLDTHTIGKNVSRSVSEECYYDELLYYMRGGGEGDTNDYALYWGDSGSPKIVMESYNRDSKKGAKGNISASATAFLMATAGIDWKKGHGNAITTKSTVEEVEKMQPTTEKKGFITNWGMKIDAFGNILCDTDKGRFIVLPACMSAFTWTSTDKSQAGQSIPINNLLTLTATDTKSNPKNSYFRFYAHQVADKGSVQYDWGLNSGLVQQTNWYPIRDAEPKSLDFSQWHWTNIVTGAGENGHSANDANIAVLCKSSELLTNIGKHTSADSDWYIPDWGGIFNSINKGGGVSQLKYIDDFVMVDDVNAFQSNSNDKFTLNPTSLFDSSEDKMYWVDDNSDGKGGDHDHSLKAYKDAGYPNGYEASEWYYSPFADTANSVNSGNNQYRMSNAKLQKDGMNKFVLGIYLSYVLAYTGDPVAKYGFNKTGLPEITKNSLVYADMTPVPDDGQRLKELQNMAYYLLHPKEGIRYVKQLFKTKVTAILVGIHEGIVGAGNKANLGVRKYIGFSGYVTTPELSDLSWTSKIVDMYTSIFIYLIMTMIIILLGYVMVGSMSIQKFSLGILTFAICAYFPPYLIDATISISNRYADSIYGSKFMYWALIESQVYAKEIETSATSGSYNDYMVTLFKNSNSNWNDDSSSTVAIALKWMCPKKNNYMYSISKEQEQHDSTASKLLNKVLKKDYSGEDFTNSANATYLYRSYNDISNYSRYLYEHFRAYGVNSLDEVTQTATETTVDEIRSTGQDASDKGFSVLDPTKDSNNRWLPLYTSAELGKALSEDVTKATQTYHYGITQETASYSLSDINGARDKISNSGLYAYEQMTESPYYYFSWNFYDEGMSSQVNAKGGFKDLMLGSKTGGIDSYFYNTKLKGAGGGEIRDYLDMRNLFTSVIPVLKQGNDKVRAWEKIYGMKTFDGVSCDPSEVFSGTGDATEWKYKHWVNVNIAQLWNMYTPWVDTMYDCSYSHPEKITVAGKTKVVTDPLNPDSYFPNEGRPMIFSRSEMTYYGLNTSDLTQVEMRIITTQDETMKDLYNLNNYYNFNDSALNTASAMITTFNFNKTFSEVNYLSSSYTLYPQNFELKNFSYDAYLRLIMANATGESLTGSDNLYQTIVENTSVLTGLLMILNDALVCYAISGLKLFFLLGIFAVSIIMIVSATIQLEIQLGKTLWESLLSPLVKFLIVSISHAWVISCFMSTGTANITGNTDTSVSLGDPSMTLVFLLVIHIVVIILYFKIVKGIIRNAIKYTRAIGNSVGGMVGGVMSGATGLMSATKSFATGGLIGGAIGGGLASATINRFRGRSNKINPNDLKGTRTYSSGGITANNINDKINSGKEKLNKTTKSGDTEKTDNRKLGSDKIHTKSERTEINDGKDAIINAKKEKKVGGIYESKREFDGIAPVFQDGKKKGKTDKANADMKKTKQSRKFNLGRFGRYESDKDYSTGKETIKKKILFGRERTITRDVDSSRFSKFSNKAKAKASATKKNVKAQAKAKAKSTVKNGASKAKKAGSKIKFSMGRK